MAKFAISFLLIVAALTLHARAQSRSDCDRAWLASDWPTAAVECTNVAKSREDYNRTTLANLVGPIELQKQGMELAWDAMVTAGVYRARAAVAYANLKRPTLDKESRDAALQDLGGAEAYLENINDTMANRAQALSAFIQSPNFVKSAPDSDLLATI